MPGRRAEWVWAKPFPTPWDQPVSEDFFSSVAKFLALAKEMPELMALTGRVEKLSHVVEKHEALLREIVETPTCEITDLAQWSAEHPEIAQKFAGKHLALTRKNGHDFEIVAVADSINDLYAELKNESITKPVEFLFVPLPSI
jgi:hypothetical protein